MAWEYYQFLGVPSDAAAEVVKRACFRKRKQLAIEEDEQGQQYLNEVSQTLQDAQARAEYDAFQQHGEEINRLFTEAVGLMQARQWHLAIPCWKRLLVFVPNQPSVCHQLGICYAESWLFPDALATFSKLLQQSPQIAQYWANYAHLLLKLCHFTPDKGNYASVGIACPHCGEFHAPAKGDGVIEINCPACRQAFLVNTAGNRAALIEQARQALGEAIRLEEYNASHYIDMANTYLDARDFPQAEQWVERVIGRSGNEDYHDLDALFHLCLIYAQSGQVARISETAQRILRALPDDQEAREYAGYRFTRWAHQLYMADAFENAVAAIDAARLILPQDQHIQELATSVTLCHAAYREYGALKNDRTIRNPQKSVIALFLVLTTVTDSADYLSSDRVKEMAETKKLAGVDARVLQAANSAAHLARLPGIANLLNEQQLLTALAGWLKSQSAANLKASINRLQHFYPKLYQLISPLYLKLDTQLASRRFDFLHNNLWGGKARTGRVSGPAITGRSANFGIIRYCFLAYLLYRLLSAIFGSHH